MRDAYLGAFGRFFLAFLFLASGLSKLGTSEATIGYIASVGVPFANLAYFITIIVEVGGGILLIVGYQSRIAALVLALFTLATAILFHSNFADQNQMIHFMKNLAVMGGLLQITTAGAGKLSLDARRAQK